METKNKLESVNLLVEFDEWPDISYLYQDGFEDRLKAYENNEFDFVGVKAIATIAIPFEIINGNGKKETNYKLQKIDSGGLWGIENDSTDEYINQVAKEQIDELKDYLEKLNVDLRFFDELIENVEFE